MVTKFLLFWIVCITQSFLPEPSGDAQMIIHGQGQEVMRVKFDTQLPYPGNDYSEEKYQSEISTPGSMMNPA
jgi:hypothetical protein